MSVEFSNAYQEILLENLMAIIKQNFMFQTQIKIAENSSKNNEELKKKVDELTVAYNTAKSELTQLNVYKTKAESNTSAHEEKNRIQAALNEELKKTSNLQKELENKNNEIKKNEEVKKQELNKLQIRIDELNNYIEKLEEIAPVTKLKKIKSGATIQKEKVILPVFEEKNDTPKIENKIQKVLDGSAF
jgi:chromosome segregation ATPase